jgi:hypothetical protein
MSSKKYNGFPFIINFFVLHILINKKDLTAKIVISRFISIIKCIAVYLDFLNHSWADTAPCFNRNAKDK